MIGRQSPPKVPVGAGRWEQGWRVPAVCLVLAAITFAVFGQTLTHEFVNFDDKDYVYANPVVARGVTLQGFVWAFTQVHSFNWHPLTWLSHELDCQLYGLHPGGHHLTNVLLHTATVIALFLVLRQMTGAFWRSAFVAAVFAIHPLRVESVAWVAERKDVLSGLLFMLTIGAYVCYTRRPWSPARYVLVMLLFALSLMCKPMLVTLPLVLLLLDYWPLQRVEPRKLSELVMEKLPLLTLSAISCVVTLLAQTGAIQSAESYSMPLRLANALATCMVYLGQMVWPVGLAVFYPYPPNGLPPWEVALAGTLVAGLSAVAVCQRRKQPWIVVGWLWYLVMLLPVVGVIQVGEQAHADRYTYLPGIGVVMAGTWLVGDWSMGWEHQRAVLGGLMAAVISILMVCAWKQTMDWKNSETLWTHTLACTTGNCVAHNNFGDALEKKGRGGEAISQFQNALEIRPNYAEAHYNLAVALLHRGRVDEAIAHFQEALKIRPDDAEAHNSLGSALLQKGRADEAITHYQKALQINPDYVPAHYNLGNILLKKGSVDEAIADYQHALQINPDYAPAHYNLGNILLKKGRVDEAIAHYQHALQNNPDNAETHINLGEALLQKGRVDEAIAHLQRALLINPDYAEAHVNLGNALLQKGRVDEAIAHFQQAMQIEPADPWVKNNLALLLATCSESSLRNGSKAVELAQQANALTGGENPIILHTLAAALAEAGRFSEAVGTAQRALHLAKAQSNTTLAGQLQAEMKLYQAGSPFHGPEQMEIKK
jgi:tetratricopeptide (TPR) repeat protein